MMEFEEFIELFKASGSRFHLIGDRNAGAVAALDKEGRVFAVLNGMTLNRVDAEAFRAQASGGKYRSPGGDVLWPAPEGTCFGYEYSTGSWRVPPGLAEARMRVAESSARGARIEAEIDLINNQGLGLPCVFKRAIECDAGANKLVLKIVETIKYAGARKLKRGEFLLAPWSLCQLDSAPGAEAVFKHVEGSVRDLYDASDAMRRVGNGLCRSRTDSSQRYQIALNDKIEAIEFVNPAEGLRVKRTARRLWPSEGSVDIADAPPGAKPSEEGARFSVYSDMNGFMEMEAVGACPGELNPGDELSFETTTEFERFQR